MKNETFLCPPSVYEEPGNTPFSQPGMQERERCKRIVAEVMNKHVTAEGFDLTTLIDIMVSLDLEG